MDSKIIFGIISVHCSAAAVLKGSSGPAVCDVQLIISWWFDLVEEAGSFRAYLVRMAVVSETSGKCGWAILLLLSFTETSQHMRLVESCPVPPSGSTPILTNQIFGS